MDPEHAEGNDPYLGYIPAPLTGIRYIAPAQRLPDQRRRGQAKTDTRQYRDQGYIDQDIGRRQLRRTHLPDNPECRGKTGRKKQLLQTAGQRQPYQAENFGTAWQPMQETIALGVTQAEEKINPGTGHHRNRRCQARAIGTECRRAKMAEDQHIVEKDIQPVHDHQRAHIQPRMINCVPVATERVIHADENDGERTHL